MSDADSTSTDADPIDQIMGETDDDAFAASLDELADFTTDEPEPVLPEDFALFEAKAETIGKIRDRGGDPRVTRIRVHPVRNGKRGSAIGNYSPEGFTLQAMQQHLPPGTYDVHGLNADGWFVGGKRVPLNNGQPISPPSINGGSQSGSSAGDKLLVQLAMRQVNGPPAGQGNEMHQAMADMVKLMAVQSQMSMQQLKLQLEVSDRDNKQQARSQGGTLDLLKMFLPMLTKQKQTNGSGKSPGVEDMMGLLQFGMQLQGMMNGKKADDDQSWMKIVPQLADSLGPGAIALVAMMLPEDKAKLVSEVLEQHQKARAAEAAAETSEDPPTVDTQGVPVGG